MDEAAAPERSVNLHRQETPFRSSTGLTLKQDGTISIHSSDPESAFWGGADYEFWVDVPPEALPQLLSVLVEQSTEDQPAQFDAQQLTVLSRQVFALLEIKYQGNMHAVDDFTKLCKREGIPHKFDTWTWYGKS